MEQQYLIIIATLCYFVLYNKQTYIGDSVNIFLYLFYQVTMHLGRQDH